MCFTCSTLLSTVFLSTVVIKSDTNQALSTNVSLDVIDSLLNSSEYDKRRRPGHASGEPTIVHIDCFVRSVSNIDERDMVDQETVRYTHFDSCRPSPLTSSYDKRTLTNASYTTRLIQTASCRVAIARLRLSGNQTSSSLTHARSVLVRCNQ